MLEKLLKETGIYWQDFDNRENLKKKIEHDPESIILAVENETVIGVVFLVYDPWCPYILHLAVDSRHISKGVGSILFRTAEERLKARGAKFVTGFVKEMNPKALEFCIRRGYKVYNKVYFGGKKL